MNSNHNYTSDKEVSLIKNDKYDYLKSVDTVKLQALLQQESFLSDDSNYDVELIRHISAILDAREPVFENFDVAASLKAFKQEIIPEINNVTFTDCRPSVPYVKNIPNRRRSKRRIATLLIAAIVTTLLGSTLVASAMGYDFWEYVINWGKDTFQIGAGAEVTSDPVSTEAAFGDGAISMGDNSSYQSVEDAVKALQVSLLTPSFIPEGFEFVQADVSKTDQRKSLIAIYTSEDSTLMFNAVIYNSDAAAYSYEIDEGSGERVEINSIEHYFMTNLEQNRVVWIKNNVVYSINGDISKDDLLKMVNSIYEGDK